MNARFQYLIVLLGIAMPQKTSTHDRAFHHGPDRSLIHDHDGRELKARMTAVKSNRGLVEIEDRGCPQCGDSCSCAAIYDLNSFRRAHP